MMSFAYAAVSFVVVVVVFHAVRGAAHVFHWIHDNIKKT